MPLPLRHRPLFWIGLLPVLILLCAWADSTYYTTSWSRSTDPDHQVTVELGRSYLGIEKMHISDRDPAVDPGSLPRTIPTGPYGTWLREAGSSRATWFPVPDYYNQTGGGSSSALFKIQIQSWRIPFWFLLGLYLPPWIWLVRRQSRRGAGEKAL